MGIRRIKGLTLIELVIAVGITAILSGSVILMLKTSFDSYSFAQEQILVEKALDECLVEISGGSFDRYGIKDALQITDISLSSITFVPLWTDDTHIAAFEHGNAALAGKTPLTLNRPFQAGASVPICEVIPPTGGSVKTAAVTFAFGSGSSKPDDRVFLNEPVEPGSKIRFIFHPDATDFKDCAMVIKWDGVKIMRAYKSREEVIPKHNVPSVVLSGFKLQYFDNANNELEPVVEQIPNITAVRCTVTADFIGRRYRARRMASVFINIRNSRAAGVGLIIKKGTTVKIPDSHNIRVFTLSNIAGIKADGMIELEARPEAGTAWKVNIAFGLDNGKPVIKKYSVEYPPGAVIYFQDANISAGQPLNFMRLDASGRYDYDFDKDGNNVVNLEGDVQLTVTRMDASGAALFIRP